jgi:hypothetical protein
MIIAIITIESYNHANYASNEWQIVNIGQLYRWLLTMYLTIAMFLLSFITLCFIKNALTFDNTILITIIVTYCHMFY